MRAYTELADELDQANEILGELICQHRSECALYGDSWPGAQIDIQKARGLFDRIRRELEAHPDHNPECANFDEIPY